MVQMDKKEEITLKQYIEKQRAVEERVLPSGLKVKLRSKLSPIRNLRILTRAGLTWDDLGTNLIPENLDKFCVEGFKELFVEPKVPEELDISDLEGEDFSELHTILIKAFLGNVSIDSAAIEEGKDEGNLDFTTPSE